MKLLFLLAFLSSCNFQKTQELKAADAIETTNGISGPNANAAIVKDKLIAAIAFQVKARAEELSDFGDGIVPWISVEKPEEDISRLIDADRVVIPYPEITLVVDYPLEHPATFTLKSRSGFTKRQLVLEVSKAYHEIYAAEDKAAKVKTIPVGERKGAINRNTTDRSYGIWGHDIGDLDLSAAEVYKTDKGLIKVLLGIES